MLVSDMAYNPLKAQVENFYIAEKKFKFHREGKTFEQVRESLSSIYGGFTKDGTYFHNKDIFTEKQPSPPRIISTKPKSRRHTSNMHKRARNKSQLEPLELTPLMNRSMEPKQESAPRRASITHMVKNLNISELIAQMQK